MLALSLPQWLHLSRTNVRALAMNPMALCILAPSLMSAPVLASLTLSLPPSHTAGSYFRDCPYSPLLLEPSADRHQHGSRPHRLGAALNLLTVSFKTPLHCCLIPRSLPLLQTFLTDLSQATDLRTHLLSFLSSVMFVRGRLHPLPHTPMPLTGSYRGMAEPKN